MNPHIHSLGNVTWRVMSLPATLLHELTHMLLALPWADESAVIFDEVGVGHYVNWADDVPRWAVVVASLGPTLIGSLVGLIGLWKLATAPPETARQWLLAGTLAAWWVIYVAPSLDDLDVADTEAQADTDSEDDYPSE